MNKSSKTFLKNAVILTIATVVVGVFMREWGAAQVIIMIMLTLLTAAQWLLFVYMKKMK